MLLQITYSTDTDGQDATDLGFLLFKNPHRPQMFELNYGKAYVFYPEISTSSTTAALLLDIDPIELARGKVGAKSGGLFDYINDRPYVSSSFLATAISRVFGTALTGRCDQKPELAKTALNLTATLTTLPCKGDLNMLTRVFEPLGYTVNFETALLDEHQPEWGISRYVNLTISGRVRVADLLKHLYVLIPVFDRAKHYWIGRDEIDKLLRHGDGWLDSHPEQLFIAERYMGGKRELTRLALDELQLDRLDDGQAGTSLQQEPTAELSVIDKPNLNARRLAAVVNALKAAGVASVIDLGCGEGKLLQLLVKDRSFVRIAGTDVASKALEIAARRLKLERWSDLEQQRLQLFQSSITYVDKRWGGYDAACVIEVIEHLDYNRLTAFEQVLFGETKPPLIVLTTPNQEYNINYHHLETGKMRHSDHRFEWTRQQFNTWAHNVASKYRYTVAISYIGDDDPVHGTPTQMAIFKEVD